MIDITILRTAKEASNHIGGIRKAPKRLTEQAGF
jgi:hypothetical protein